MSELRNLNNSVNDWIGKHVRENPYVDLTPIFRYLINYLFTCESSSGLCVGCRDYEKHLKELDKKFQSHDPTTVQRGEEGSEVTSSDVIGPGIGTALCLCVSE